jgi:hypothetical protein
VNGILFVAVDFLPHAGGPTGDINSTDLIVRQTHTPAIRRVFLLVFDEILFVYEGKTGNVLEFLETLRFDPGLVEELSVKGAFLIGPLQCLFGFFKLERPYWSRDMVSVFSRNNGFVCGPFPFPSQSSGERVLTCRSSRHSAT